MGFVWHKGSLYRNVLSDSAETKTRPMDALKSTVDSSRVCDKYAHAFNVPVTYSFTFRALKTIVLWKCNSKTILARLVQRDFPPDQSWDLRNFDGTVRKLDPPRALK